MRTDPEHDIRERFEADAFCEAATLALERYGPEILGWLVATTGDAGLAEECFSEFSEDMWTGFPALRWESSLRTWLYVLARNALVRLKRSPRVRRERVQSHISDVALAVRTRTRPWLQTEVKDRFRELRDALDEDSRSLLILRVDRRMKLEDIARVLDEPGEPKQASARLRKRFAAIKERLRARAQADGLLER